MPPYKPELLPIKHLQWEKFVHLIGKANAAAARFDGLLQSIPNATVLLSPLTTQEAVLSSKIEGTQATFQEVLTFEANPHIETGKKDEIQEILNYRKAMHYAIGDLNKISMSNRLIMKVHSVLLENTRGQNKDRGNFRKIQVHIGRSGRIDEASYIPPSPLDVPDLMSNLEKYIHSDEKDYFLQLAIIHAQFEMIHPFMDGNGRVGRIMMPLFLFFKGFLSSPSFYLSSYFEANRSEYYNRLLGISQENDWEGWIKFFLNAVAEQTQINIQKARDILELYNAKKERITSLTHSQFSIRALDYIFSYPIFTSSDFIQRSAIPKQSAMLILKLLVDGGVIELFLKGRGRKPNTYIFSKLIMIVG
ncbi:MAG: Fic family protein [FCB group bacterium]|nr:Fic family protein [FCB group bacterium]